MAIESGPNRTLAGYLEQLGSGAPTPGGGSASAYAGAFGASLIAMVARLTKPAEDSTRASQLGNVAAEANDFARALAEAAVRDEAVYGRYRAAVSLPKSTDMERSERVSALQGAIREAANAPVIAARIAVRAIHLASKAAEIGSTHALSDIRTAVHLLNASISGALENVMVNLALIRDEKIRSALIGDVQAIQADLGVANAAIEAALARRAPLKAAD